MDDKRVIQEHKRLENLLSKADIPQQKRDALEVVIDELAWQRIKLEETRDAMKDSEVVIPYDNGGGQSGMRENPIFKAYINLWRSYMLGLDKYTSYLPKELQDETSSEGLSILEQVKNMKRANR